MEGGNGGFDCLLVFSSLSLNLLSFVRRVRIFAGNIVQQKCVHVPETISQELISVVAPGVNASLRNVLQDIIGTS